METKVETITPTMAAKWLENNPRNRTVSKHRVGMYSRQMKHGHWRLTHQGIAFNCDGSLKDGQHRLAAIVESGVPVTMMVTRGLSNDAVGGIDLCRPRTFADVYRMRGMETTKTEVSLARRMWSIYCEQVLGYAKRQIRTDADADTLLAFINHHRDAISFALTDANKHGIKAAPVRAAIAAAWWTVDNERLAQFRTQLSTGVVDNASRDGAVLRIRDYLLNTVSTTGEMRAREIYGRTATALQAYLEGRNITKLFWRKDVVFWLPHVPGIALLGDE